MSLVKVKKKYQVTIPAEIRKELNLKVGDYLEVKAQGTAIILKPKAVIDRGKEEAWERLRELLERVHRKIGEVPGGGGRKRCARGDQSYKGRGA